MRYYPRIVDQRLDRLKEAFNAISIVGPKGCGKTRTAKERCKTLIEFQDEEKREGYLTIAETAPRLFLKNEKPILFDEWQDAPKIWGMIRKDCDDNPEAVGEFYLTGSTNKDIDTPHTGTGRITQVEMFPMTMYEMGESNGSVSISKIVADDAYEFSGAISDLSLEDLFYCACRGGWPRCLALKSKEAKLEIARDYFKQIYTKDISAFDGVKRNSEWARVLLWSYARNMATTAKKGSIYADDMGLEADAVYQAADGRYALIEIKLGINRVPEAETSLLRFRTAIIQHNKKALENKAHPKPLYREPSALIVICGNAPMAYTTEKGIHVIPVGCMKD